MTNVIFEILKENKIKKVSIPENLKVKYAKNLLDSNIKFEIKAEPFFETRAIKTKEEIINIKQTQKAVENAASKAISIIKRSRIRKDGKLEFRGKILIN